MKFKRTLLIGTVAAIAAAITISIESANDDNGPTAEVRDDVQETPPPGETRPTKAGTSKPEIANLIHLVERSRLSEAAQLAADNNVGLDRAVMQELSRRQSQSDLDPQVHFNFLHFFLKYGTYGNASNPEQLRADYCRLLNELEIPDLQAAFLPSTERLYDLHVERSSHPLHRSDPNAWEDAFKSCVDVLSDRPEDTAAWRGLENIMRYHSRATTKHVLDLRRICKTPLSKTRLASLVVDCKVDADQIDAIVEDALPAMATDSRRARTLYHAGFLGKVKRTAEQTDAIAARILVDYPRTRTARSALHHRLASIAARDVDLALRELAAVSVEMELSAEEIEQQQRTIVGAPFRQLLGGFGQPFPSGKSGHSESVEEQRRRAKALLARLIEQATSDRQRLITLGIQIADAEHDAEALNRFAGIWMDANRFSDRSPMESSSVAPIIASHYAATDRWQKAHDAWKRWPASNGFCMSWDVFPSEIRLVQMSICKLHQQEYRQAVDILVKGMTDPEVDSRCLLPLLLFHIYRRADQLDDLWVILDQWSDNEAFGEFNKPGFGDGGTGMTISRMRSQRARLMELRELATEKDWPALIRVCRDAKENAKSTSHMPAYRYGSLLEGSLAAHASVLLSEADREGANAIENYYRGLPNTAVAERRGNDFWIVRSLMENQSEEAQRFLQSLRRQNPLIRYSHRRRNATPIEQLAEQAHQSGAFAEDDHGPPNGWTKPDIPTLRIFFQWNSPPNGSLRAVLPYP